MYCLFIIFCKQVYIAVVYNAFLKKSQKVLSKPIKNHHCLKTNKYESSIWFKFKCKNPLQNN